MSKFSAEKTYALFNTPANKKFRAALSAAGAKTILFSAVETNEVETNETSNVLNDLRVYDWLIFPDIYAVEFFLQKLGQANFDLFELDALRVCAYGESVADRLRFAQLHADVIPHSIKTAHVWNALKNYLFDESELKTLRFLILKQQNSVVEIAGELQKRAAIVEELAIYQTETGESSETAKSKSLLRGGAIDEFIFTSPFDAINLAHLFPNENLTDVLEDVEIFAADNQVRQSLQEFRIFPDDALGF